MLQLHPRKRNEDLTLKELALLVPRFPSIKLLFIENGGTGASPEYPDIGDIPIKVFVQFCVPEELLKYRNIGPKTISSLKAIFKEAGLIW